MRETGGRGPGPGRGGSGSGSAGGSGRRVPGGPGRTGRPGGQDATGKPGASGRPPRPDGQGAPGRPRPDGQGRPDGAGTGRPGSSGRQPGEGTGTPGRPGGAGKPRPGGTSGRSDGQTGGGRPRSEGASGRQGGQAGAGRSARPEGGQGRQTGQGGAGRPRPAGSPGTPGRPAGAGKPRPGGTSGRSDGQTGGGRPRSEGASGRQGGQTGAGRSARPEGGQGRQTGQGGAGRPRPGGSPGRPGASGGGGRARSEGTPGRPGGPAGGGRPRSEGASGRQGGQTGAGGSARPERSPGRPGASAGTRGPGSSGRPVRVESVAGPTRQEDAGRPRTPRRPPRPGEDVAPGTARPGAGRGDGRAGDLGRAGGRIRLGGTPPRPPARPPAVLRLGNPGRRISVGLIGMTFVLSIFAGRLIQLQGLDSKVYTAKAAEQRVRPEKLPARRGAITDADGHELALTLEAREIFIDPSVVSAAKRDQVATALAAELGVQKEPIMAKLAAGGRYQQVAAAVDPTVAQRIMDRDFKGVGSKHRYRRDYPGGDLAGTLLGFVGSDGTGLSGLESTYNKLLAGRDGEQFVETGLEGQRIPMTGGTLKAPVDGGSVRLTVNRDIQWAAQKAIADQVKAVGARTGSAIVMDVQTGHLLAMANAPELDLKNWQKAPPEDWVNRSVTDVFEPGSTNKVITAAAALESGAVRPESVFSVRDNIRCADQVLRDSHPHPMERLTFSGVVATSSNVGTILAAQKVGDEKLYGMLQRFGFGVKPGSGLPGEEAGLLPDWRNWSGSQRCTVAYGQGVSVTALQTASVYQTIANGGTRVTPRIVAGTTNGEGVFTPSAPGARTRVIGERTAKEIAGMLEAAVSTDGTGNLAAIDGYRVAGKTGTAMRYDTRCQGYCGYTSTFVGFAPADKPRLVVLAVVQDPQKGHYGGEIAAPVFKKVMTFALKSKKIPPTGTRPPAVRIRAGE
ncbi:penicillin-binding transpeptidase domain-containing protein [Streptosporangium carneum]|uniref:penicillin-binding transpeptidase domain-containing protein n=1 Tax=Streptosporangium carneum TaxID=47481 RepID=UPI0031E8424A